MKLPEIPHSRPWITDADIESVRETVASGMLAHGDRVFAFEQLIADYHGASGAVAMPSGTAALALSLLALDVGNGDEVVLPTYTCNSVAAAVRAVGATPIYCDVGDEWLMTPQSVSAVLTSKTKAIILIHIFGIFADARTFAEFGLPVVEDACQAFGGRRQEATSELTVFSFHATKCLTTGEGGAVAAHDKTLLKKLQQLRDSNRIPGRMTDVQAALGISQLSRYAEFLQIRQAQANRYFSNLPTTATMRLGAVRSCSMFFRFPLTLNDRNGSFEDARQFFAKRGIAVRQGVDTLLHRESGHSDASFPGAVARFNETVSIPLRPGLTEGELDRVIDTVSAYVGR